MLSKNQLKYYKSLALKKNRDSENIFIAEGPKLVEDLLPHFEPKIIFVEAKYSTHFPDSPSEILSADDIKKISLQKQPQGVYAVFKRRNADIEVVNPKLNLVLALDDIQDPGNLGTIIRICDWFGIEHIVCSSGTVDAYNPKVVQSTMGALGRVSVHYTDLSLYLTTADCHIYGTFLEGEPLYDTNLTSNGIIVMGNEGNGISEQVAQRVNSKLFIPNFPLNRETSESLNVATATAIVCAEFRRLHA